MDSPRVSTGRRWLASFGVVIMSTLLATSRPALAIDETHTCLARNSALEKIECPSAVPASGVELRYVISTPNAWEIFAWRRDAALGVDVKVVLAGGPATAAGGGGSGILLPMPGDRLVAAVYKSGACTLPIQVPQPCAPDIKLVWTNLPATTGGRIGDGDDCNGSSASYVNTNADAGANDLQNADRGAVCLRANGMTIFYLGGEVQAEDPANKGRAGGGSSSYQHGACGAVIVAGSTYGSGHDDRNRDASKSAAERDADWSFAHRHPGPDGVLNTEDDVFHSHDCD